MLLKDDTGNARHLNCLRELELIVNPKVPGTLKLNIEILDGEENLGDSPTTDVQV